MERALDPATETKSDWIGCGFAAESAFNLLISAHSLPLLQLAARRADISDGAIANTLDTTSVSLRFLWAASADENPFKGAHNQSLLTVVQPGQPPTLRRLPADLYGWKFSKMMCSSSVKAARTLYPP